MIKIIQGEDDMVKMDQQKIECRSDKIVNIPKILKIKKSEIIMDIEVGKHRCTRGTNEIK